MCKPKQQFQRCGGSKSEAAIHPAPDARTHAHTHYQEYTLLGVGGARPSKFSAFLPKVPKNRIDRLSSPVGYACFTLADPTPRLCPDAVGSANVNGFPTRDRLSGPHREAIGISASNIKHV